MKRGLFIFALLLVFSVLFAVPAKAANEAAFSVTTQTPNPNVGDTVQVSFAVDAGTFATTLDAIDMYIKISDPSVLEVKDQTNPFVAGQIYSQVGIQEYSNGTLHLVLNIDPNNKPANRSGLIGTVDFTAQKAGQAIITYDQISATQEGSQTDLISTTATSLEITVGSGAPPVGGPTTATPTPVLGASTTASVSTGPEQAILIALIGGLILFLGYRMVIRPARKS
jgi:hypothetical protein